MATLEMFALWKAHPHPIYGGGKLHRIDAGSDPPKLLCGKLVKAVPGESAGRSNGTLGVCKSCIQQVEKRQQREERERVRELERRAREEEYQRERAERNAHYQQYLQSQEWKDKRKLVLHRAHGMCEGCLMRSATEVHHTTYDHLFNEFLWELKAICRSCHERTDEALARPSEEEL